MSKDISKQKVFEIVRKRDNVEKDLKKFTKLKKEAFQVFNNDISSTLDCIQKSYGSGAWYELRLWHDYTKVHSGHFHFENEYIIEDAFQQLSEANINRKEFKDMLSGCCNDIERYIKELTDELNNLNQQLDNAYDDFVQNETGDYKWIFEQPFVKELVLKILLS